MSGSNISNNAKGTVSSGIQLVALAYQVDENDKQPTLREGKRDFTVARSQPCGSQTGVP